MSYSQIWTNSTPAHPLPVTVAPTLNRVILMYVITDAADGNTFTFPAGFSTPVSAQSTFDSTDLAVAYKVSDGSETSLSVSNTNGRTMIGGVIEFSNISTSTPLDLAIVLAASSTSGTTIDASITPVTNGVDLISIIDADTAGSDVTFSWATTAGTTGAWTQRADQGDGAFFNVGIATTTQATAGAITVRGTQSVAGGRVQALIALRPLVSPPVITAQPTNQTVNNGATATFTVTATGATSYQWKKNGANISGATGSSVNITAAYADQGAQITVDCTNADGTTTSTAATLRVAYNLTGAGPRRRQAFASAPLASTGPRGAPASGLTAVGQDQSHAYTIISAVGSSQGGAYVIRSAAGQDQPHAYVIRSAVGQDQAGAYTMRSAVGQDQSAAHTIRAAVGQDQAGAYIIRSAAGQDQVHAYAIRAAVGNEQVGSYLILSAAGQSQASAYVIRAAVGQDQTHGYAIDGASNSVGASQAGSYTIFASAGQDQVNDHTIRSAVGQDQAGSHVVRAAAGQDQASNYVIRSVAGRDQLHAYVIREAVGAGGAHAYLVLAEVGQASAGSYTIRAAAGQDQAHAHLISQAAGSSQGNSYTIGGGVLLDAYTQARTHLLPPGSLLSS